jgi:hypothetical protein
MSSRGPGKGWPPARNSLSTGQLVDRLNALDLRVPPPDSKDGETDQPWGNELSDPAPNSFRIRFLNHGGFQLLSCNASPSQAGNCICKKLRPAGLYLATPV